MDMRQIYWHIDKQEALREDAFKYCPLCGSQLDPLVIDHRTRRICPGCGYIHFRNPAPTVSLFIIERDQVLLGTRSGDDGIERWATPSGYIEIDEDFLTTAVREAKEETGLNIQIAGIINVTDSFFPPEQHFLNIYLLAQATGGDLQPGDDMGNLRWFPLAGPFPEMAFQEDIDLIERYRQGGCVCLPVEAGYR